MEEYWIEIKGHPRYRVSTMGRVKCVDWKRTGKERILKPFLNDNGYFRVKIDGVNKYVHRLVLESFMPNPQNKPCIDHKDTNRLNNRIENLRFCTHTENSRNPLTLKHMSDNASMLGKFGAEHNSSIPIVQLTIDGKFIRKWPATKDVERELGFNHSNITQCCKGKRKSAGGFRWVYASNYQKHISDINPLF